MGWDAQDWLKTQICCCVVTIVGCTAPGETEPE